MAKTDETDLVDVKEFPVDEDVTEARDQSAFAGRFKRDASEPSATERDSEDESNTVNDGEEPFAIQMEAPEPGQTTVASLRERLAAFLVDMGVLWLVFWGCLFVLHKVTTHNWIGPVPTMGTVAMFFHGAFLLLAFFYFFLFESAFFATIGKFCCWMYVRRKDGHHAGVFSIFIRNFFRLGELVTAGLLTWVPMELTRRHQRFGDMAAGTIVIKKHSATAKHYNLESDVLASAFGRSFAQVIDLALVLIWLAGYVLLIDYQSLILSQWLVILFPLLTVLFWTLVQVILETTPGLWLFGYTISHEDGGPLTFAGAMFRVLAAPIDLVLGLPCMLLSLRKQKVGDLLAATVVSRQRRRWKGAIGSLVVIALTVGLAALGLFINPLNNAFKARTEFKFNFMPTVEGLPTWDASSAAIPQVLTLRNFRFGVNDPNTRRTPPVYEAGETVYLLFEISGYTRKERMVWIQEDLMVQYPNGTIGLKQENVVDYHQIVKPGGGQIELTNNVALPATAAPGTYVVTVTLRDLLSDNFTVTETQSFTVKAPPAMTSPLEAPPPAPLAPSPIPVDPYNTSKSAPSSPATPTLPQAGVPITGDEKTATVPSSPLPVIPTSTPPTTPTSTTTTTTTTTTTAPTPPVDQYAAKKVDTAIAATPTTDGFTSLPGPSIAPKQEAAPVPTIPVTLPTPAASPTDQYGSKPVAPISTLPTSSSSITPDLPKATPPAIVEKTLPSIEKPADTYGSKVAAPSSTAPLSPSAVTSETPKATPPAIVEKTLPSIEKPTDQYGSKSATPAIIEKTLTPTPPKDSYAKPVAPVSPAPTAPPPAPAAAPAKKTAKEPAKTEAVPAAKEAKPATPKPAATKPAVDTEMKKAAEKELKKIAPTTAPAKVETSKPAPTPAAAPSKPAADIPSASAVKAQSEEDAAAAAKPKPKKKKASSGGGSSGGYMP